jgi:hypothetical protein
VDLALLRQLKYQLESLPIEFGRVIPTSEVERLLHAREMSTDRTFR